MLPEKWNLLGDAEALVARRRGARRRPVDRSRPRLGAQARRQPGRRQHRRAGRGRASACSTPPACSTPTGSRWPPTARSTCSTSTSAASATASPTPSEPARRSSAPRSAGVGIGLTVCYDLRFPELYRILAVARGAGAHRALRVHAGDRARPLGGAAARAGDREPGLRRRRQPASARRRPHYSSYGRSMIVDPWGVVLAQAPDGDGFAIAELDLDPARARSAPRCPRSPTAARTPTAGPSRWRRIG